MSCEFLTSNTTIVNNLPFSIFQDSFIKRLDCMATYLRPDPGGAAIPWLYAVFLLVFHLPACLIRAVRWESAQYLALGLAVLGIALTIQSYVATGLEAETVLVWMPLTLILDVGAMMQMVVLIIEKHGFWNLVDAFTFSVRRVMGRVADVPPLLGAALQRPEIFRHAIVALFAFIFLKILLILQILGLVYAVRGRNGPDIKVKWCSPAFRDFAVAVVIPGTCEVYPVKGSSSNGIGCIQLKAHQQADWLTGTVVCLSASLIVQVLDMVLLRCARGKWRWRGVTMQRPWLTMFSGILMIVILITFGIYNAGRLPAGISSLVWIFRKSEKEEIGAVCWGRLNSPGLRGMIIGWTDGLFDSWGWVYHGTP